MYKRHLLVQQLHAVVLGDQKYSEEAKAMTREYAVWSAEEREDVQAIFTIFLFLKRNCLSLDAVQIVYFAFLSFQKLAWIK